MVRYIAAFGLMACVLAASGESTSAQDDKKPKVGIDITYDPPPQPLALDASSLCRNAPSVSGKLERVDGTIRDLLGPNLVSIKVHYYSKKHWQNFDEAKSALGSLLSAKSNDGNVYRYQAWAEAVGPTIVATIEYKNKKKGDLQVGGAGTHICFQDQEGVHWWARLGAQPLQPKK